MKIRPKLYDKLTYLLSLSLSIAPLSAVFSYFFILIEETDCSVEFPHSLDIAELHTGKTI